MPASRRVPLADDLLMSFEKLAVRFAGMVAV